MFKNVQTVDWTDVQEAQAGQAGPSLTRTAMNPNSPVWACKNLGGPNPPPVGVLKFTGGRSFGCGSAPKEGVAGRWEATQ
jgi:hypothetical protein